MHRGAIAVLAFTGVRAGDCRNLRYDKGDVDLENGWIHFVSRPGFETKTGNSWKVPIHPRLHKILACLPRERREFFFNENPSPKYPEGDNHLNMKLLNESFQDELKKLGVKVGRKNGGFTLHSLRSFFKSFCITQGTPREVVDTWQDHSANRPAASDRYFKLDDTTSRELMQKVPFGDELDTEKTSVEESSNET